MSNHFPSWRTAMKSLSDENPQETSHRSMENSVYSYDSDDRENLHQVSVFSGILRESMANRQDEQELEEDVSCQKRMVRSFLKRHRPSYKVSEDSSFTESTDGDDSLSLDEIFGEEYDMDERATIFEKMLGCLISMLVSCKVVVIIDEGDAEKGDTLNEPIRTLMLWDMDRIGWCLIIVVFLEIMILIGFVVTSVTYDGR